MKDKIELIIVTLGIIGLALYGLITNIYILIPLMLVGYLVFMMWWELK